MNRNDATQLDVSQHGESEHGIPSPAKLSLIGVEKRYLTRRGQVVALAPTDLTVRAGDFLGIVGPSGCGKSTLLMIAAGLEPASAGRVLTEGEPLSGPGPDRCVVFQRFALFPTKTVKSNVEFGLRMAGMAKVARNRLVGELIAQTGLTGFENAFPHELSGGMQQRVALARALVMRPDVLLMDEPFGGLDAQTGILMQEEIARLARDLGLTVLLVTHNVEEAVFLCNRVVIMTARPGHIKQEIRIDDSSGWRDGGVDGAMEHPLFTDLQRQIWHSVREELAIDSTRDTAQ